MHLFGTETQLEKLSKLGDPLLKINQLIDWEMFRSHIENVIRKVCLLRKTVRTVV